MGGRDGTLTCGRCVGKCALTLEGERCSGDGSGKNINV
jgi:hypothetical protein